MGCGPLSTVLEPGRDAERDSPKDYRKNIRAMGSAATGFTQDAAHALGLLSVLWSDISTGMTATYGRESRTRFGHAGKSRLIRFQRAEFQFHSDVKS